MKQVMPSTNTYLIVDKREKDPTLLHALKNFQYKYEWKTLKVGDYACSDGCCSVERKQADFTVGQINSMNRQFANLQSTYDNAYLVVNDTIDNWLRSDRNWDCRHCRHTNHKKAIYCIKCSKPYPSYISKMGYITSLSARGLTPHWIPNHVMMLDWIIGTIYKNHDTKFRGPGAYRPLRQVTHRDQSMNILISLPGVGGGLASEILNNFDSVGEFLRADTKTWLQVKGMGKGRVKKILDAFWKGDQK